MNLKARKILLELYQAAVQRVHGQSCVHQWLNENQQIITPDQPLFIVSIGKAASAMLQGSVEYLEQSGLQTESQSTLYDVLSGGLLITKYGHMPTAGFMTKHGELIEVIEAAHPEPDSNSLKAGSSLVEHLQQLPENAQILFLISGGTSSLVEYLPEAVSLKELQTLNHFLIANGYGIEQINKVRKQVSLIKQGGLLRYIKSQRVTALYISDVPGNSPAIIGSGLLVDGADHDTEWYQRFVDEVPDNIRQILDREVSGTQEVSCRPAQRVIASIDSAMLAAKNKAEELGLNVNIMDCQYGELTASANNIYQQLINMAPGVLITGGEVTLSLPETPGRGGRNQSMALAVADKLASARCENIAFMAIGTDGTDGPGEDAGAIVDCQSCERAYVQGYDAQQCLQAANAGSFLEASGDLISTGPTGTNVMDLYIGIKQ